MAALRFLCVPPRAPLSSSLKTHRSSNFPASSLSLSLSSLSHRLSLEPATTTRLFVLSSFPPSSADSAIVDNPSALGSPNQEEEEAEEVSRTRLCAQNLPWTSTLDDVRTLFEKHGTVLDIELPMFNKSRNRGLAFVTMGSEEEALAALTSLEASEVEGRALKLNYARPRKNILSVPAPPRRYDLFVGNLSYEVRDKSLKEFFDGGNGNVVAAKVVFHDNPKRHSGYGYVTYGSKAEAVAARNAFQGKMLMGKRINVEPTRTKAESGDPSPKLNQDVEMSGKADGA